MSDEDIALRAIYKQTFPMVKKLILDNNGREEEVLDIFQDTVLIFFNNVSADRYKGNSTISTYLYGIARNQWHQHLRKTKRIRFDGNVEESDLIEVTIHEKEEIHVIRTVAKFLDKLDADCRKLLNMFYFENKSMQFIKETFGLGSEQAAKTKKFRCMKKLEGHFKSDNISRDSFSL